MPCIKNTHIKYFLTALSFLTLITILAFYYFALYKINPNQYLILKKNETNIRQKQEVNKTKIKLQATKNPSKFIVYECRGWCGGFADRLKGKFKLGFFNSCSTETLCYLLLFFFSCWSPELIIFSRKDLILMK